MGNKIFTGISTIIFILALGVLVYSLLIIFRFIEI